MSPLEADVKRLYIDEGKSANDCAEALGITPNAIRRMKYKHKWERDPIFRKINHHSKMASRAGEVAQESARRAWQTRNPGKINRYGPRSDKTDAELIAEAIANGKVTILAPGRAAGLSQIESVLGTAPVPGNSWFVSQKASKGRVPPTPVAAVACALNGSAK